MSQRKTLEELENELPNGLHDASLLEFSVGVEAKTLTLLLEVDISDAAKGERRIIPRRMRLTISGLVYFEIEAQWIEKYTLNESFFSQIDSGVLNGERADLVRPTGIPDSCFASWIYENATFGLMKFAGEHAEFEWLR